MTAIALIGLGDIGLRAHLPALLRNPDVQLTALVDPDPARRKLAAEAAPGVPVHESADALRAADAAVLATPPWITATLIREQLAAGRHVLAEKPIATDLHTAESLRGSPHTDRLQVGFTYRHDPAMERLRDWIAAGRLGAPPYLVRAHIYDELRDPADPAHADRIRATLGHGLPVVHDGAHLFDWLWFLLGERPAVADAWAVRTAPDAPAANLTGARLTYPSGTTALVEVGWWADRLPPCELQLLGDRGHAVLDCATFRLTLDTAAGREVYDPPGERTERCFDRQLERFVDLTTGRLPRAVPGLEEGLASLALSERIAEEAVRA
ncbi:Gfo/Idh/MocA family protein [Streptomyces boninensis]|uniref:Gfo/Idh/MocA family protein n=1 Tax=Streptomyces boninensis TaxID=2039455 RepID=UPI003B21B122